MKIVNKKPCGSIAYNRKISVTIPFLLQLIGVLRCERTFNFKELFTTVMATSKDNVFVEYSRVICSLSQRTMCKSVIFEIPPAYYNSTRICFQETLKKKLFLVVNKKLSQIFISKFSRNKTVSSENFKWFTLSCVCQ